MYIALLAHVPAPDASLGCHHGQVKFTPAEIDTSDFFGYATANSGDTVIASALYFDRINGTAGVFDRPGGAFIFTFNTTTRQFVQEAVFEGERNGDNYGRSSYQSDLLDCGVHACFGRFFVDPRTFGRLRRGDYWGPCGGGRAHVRAAAHPWAAWRCEHISNRVVTPAP